MAATISNKEKDKLPDWALSTVNQVEDLGFSRWAFDPLYPVLNPDDMQRVQIRDEGHVGQRSEVLKYAEAMKRGDKFPPGVVTKDGRIVDFNTRAKAAYKLGWPTFPVIVIQEDYDGADAFTTERFHILGAAFNTGGPKPLTRKELSDQIRRAAADSENWDTNKLSKHLHVKRTIIQGVFAEFRAEKRAEALGISFNGSVNPSTKAMFGQRSEKLADEPFREAVRLTQDAGLTGEEASNLVKAVIAITTGDADRLTYIANERTARDQQIASFVGGGKRKPALSSMVRPKVEFILQFADAIDSLVDHNPNTREEYLELIDKAETVLSRLVVAQRRANETGEVD